MDIRFLFWGTGALTYGAGRVAFHCMKLFSISVGMTQVPWPRAAMC